MVEQDTQEPVHFELAVDRSVDRNAKNATSCGKGRLFHHGLVDKMTAVADGSSDFWS